LNVSDTASLRVERSTSSSASSLSSSSTRNPSSISYTFNNGDDEAHPPAQSNEPANTSAVAEPYRSTDQQQGDQVGNIGNDLVPEQLESHASSPVHTSLSLGVAGADLERARDESLAPHERTMMPPDLWLVGIGGWAGAGFDGGGAGDGPAGG